MAGKAGTTTHCWYSIVLQIIWYFTPFSLWSAHRRPGLASSDACVFVCARADRPTSLIARARLVMSSLHSLSCCKRYSGVTGEGEEQRSFSSSSVVATLRGSAGLQLTAALALVAEKHTHTQTRQRPFASSHFTRAGRNTNIATPGRPSADVCRQLKHTVSLPLKQQHPKYHA